MSRCRAPPIKQTKKKTPLEYRYSINQKIKKMGREREREGKEQKKKTTEEREVWRRRESDRLEIGEL